MCLYGLFYYVLLMVYHHNHWIILAIKCLCFILWLSEMWWILFWMRVFLQFLIAIVFISLNTYFVFALWLFSITHSDFNLMNLKNYSGDEKNNNKRAEWNKICNTIFQTLFSRPVRVTWIRMLKLTRFQRCVNKCWPRYIFI